jgi:hypothetical protein
MEMPSPRPTRLAVRPRGEIDGRRCWERHRSRVLANAVGGPPFRSTAAWSGNRLWADRIPHRRTGERHLSAVIGPPEQDVRVCGGRSSIMGSGETQPSESQLRWPAGVGVDERWRRRQGQSPAPRTNVCPKLGRGLCLRAETPPVRLPRTHTALSPRRSQLTMCSRLRSPLVSIPTDRQTRRVHVRCSSSATSFGSVHFLCVG